MNIRLLISRNFEKSKMKIPAVAGIGLLGWCFGRTVRSARAHQCESCWGPIPAWQRHEMIAQIDDEGLFTTPLRLHLKGECTYPEEEM